MSERNNYETLEETYPEVKKMSFMNKGFDNPASTGSISWVVYFKTANGSSSRPALRINPNSTDDARLPQQESQLTFMEYTT